MDSTKEQITISKPNFSKPEPKNMLHWWI